MTQLLDNKGQGKVGDTLVNSIQAGARLSFVSSLFSIYAYAELKDQLIQADELRLLIPLNAIGSISTASNPSLQAAGLVGDDEDRIFRNLLNLTEIARECAEWLEQKADIKAVSLTILQNLFHKHHYVNLNNS